MSTPGETLASRLLAYRLGLGLTRNQASLQIGYIFDTYVATETGARLPQPIEVPAIALWLQAPVEELREQLAWEHALSRSAKRAPSPPDASAVGPGPAGAIHAADAAGQAVA